VIRDRRDVLRLVAAGVVVVAFVVLAVIAIAASRSDFSLSAPAGATERPTEPAPLPEVPPLAVLRQPTAAPPPVATPVLAPVPTVPAVEGPAPLESLPAAPDATTGKPCAAFNLPAPSQVGGLQSLIRLVPLFGPFSAEAFAMMPAFEPGFEVLGPLFPLFELGLDSAAPVLDAITPPAKQLTQALFDLVEPGYAPMRPDVLSAEAQLAVFLQPIMQSLADTPGSECLVALEGVLASLVL
jgi:hypothetical protein